MTPAATASCHVLVRHSVMSLNSQYSTVFCGAGGFGYCIVSETLKVGEAMVFGRLGVVDALSTYHVYLDVTPHQKSKSIYILFSQ